MENQIKILGIGAHGCDVFGRAGGTIARYIKNGHKATIVALTYGERGEAESVWGQEGMTVEKVKELKKKEITEAAKILGVDIRMLDYDDNPLEFNRERFLELVDIIREEKPDIVLTHWINDWLNWDHATTAEWTVRAVWSAARKGIVTKTPVHKVKEIYMFMPSGVSEEVVGFRPDILIDVSDMSELKKKFIEVFATQADSHSYFLETTQGYRGKQAGVKYAEAFVRFSKGVSSGSLKFLPLGE